MVRRIVLVNDFGDELFGGRSVLSQQPKANQGDAKSQPCPATLRSSGLHRRADAATDPAADTERAA
jgi:hypothetical protein